MTGYEGGNEKGRRVCWGPYTSNSVQSTINQGMVVRAIEKLQPQNRLLIYHQPVPMTEALEQRDLYLTSPLDRKYDHSSRRVWV